MRMIRTSRLAVAGPYVSPYALATATLVLGLLAWASLARAERLEFDASAEPAAGASMRLAAARALAQDPALARLGRVASWDDGAGVPSFLWATPPAATPASARALVSGRRPTPERAARDHLARLGAVYRIAPGDADAATLRYTRNTGHGVVVALRQTVGGIDVFRDQVTLLMNGNLDLLAVSGSIPSRSQLAGGGAPSFGLGARQALARVLDDFTAGALGVSSIRELRVAAGGFERADVEAPAGATGALSRAPRIKRVLFHLGDALLPAYYAEVFSDTEACSYVVAADDGRLLFRHNLMASDTYTYRVWTRAGAPGIPADGPQGDATTPHPTGSPNGYTPPFVAPALMSLESGPIASHDPWLPAAATQTTGNNVDAYADLASPDGFSAGDLRASTSATRVFDRSYDPNLAPNANTTQQMAAITQLFYDNNFLHDWFYDAGFDEAAGNAQASNYGRGGVEGDRMHAEAQDYGGFSNANMSTPSDGDSPRMQMYVFNNGQTWRLMVNAPASIAYEFGSNTAAFGPQTFSVTGTVVLANDGSGTASDACEPITNDVAGKIAMIDRGTCAFTSKVLAAQNAGAIGVIIVDNVAAPGAPALPGSSAAITIPAMSVVQADGATIKARLANGVNATLFHNTPRPRDGAIDNQIVAHEWGHYISNRLIGDANGLTTLQSRGLGEGWGDFTAMLMTVEPGDGDFSGAYAVGGYAMSAPGIASDYFYYGVRRCPYSTDFTKNALTLRHIQDGVALPATTPINGPASGFDNAEPHNTGEVWCSMLWECYAALLRDSGRLTFDEARDRMRRYLVTAFELTPRQPTLLEARDAVLAAAYAADAADYHLFWQAFAKRGAGVGAAGPTRYATGNWSVTESYTTGGDLGVVSMALSDDRTSCDHDGYLDDGEVGRLTVTLTNTGSEPLSATTATVTSTNPFVSFPGENGNTLVFGTTAPFQSTTAAVDVRLAGAAGLQTMDLHLSYADPGLVPGARDTTLELYANVDESASTTESVVAADPGWTTIGDADRAIAPWTRIEASPTSHRFHGTDPGSDTDQSLVTPPLAVAGSGSLTLQFHHRFSFEADASAAYDGGVIEISTNNGSTWTDIGSAVAGYNGTLVMGSGNPLAGRAAFVGRNPAWPAFDAVNLNLGAGYANKTVRVRFRLGADTYTGDEGWDLDDLVVTNLTNPPFVALGADLDACAPLTVNNRAPGALAFSIAGEQPVRGAAQFRIELPAAARLRLAIYDVSGRAVATVADGEYAAGIHAAAWARDDRAPAGVYFARLTVAGETRTVRFVTLR